MSKKCNRDCFNCRYDDCIIETVTKEERIAQNLRDIKYTDYGNVLKARKQRNREMQIQ